MPNSNTPPAQLVGPSAQALNGSSPDDAPATPKIIKSWDKIGLTLSNSGSPIINLDNAIKVFERALPSDLIWFDDFHQKYYTCFDFTTLKNGDIREWSDIDDLAFTAFFQRGIGLSKMGDDMVHKAAVLHARRNVKNAPRDFLTSLAWDGVDRCEMFMTDCMGAEDNHYCRSASLNFWLTLVARILQPGCQVDNMIVLEGKQGIGKTRAMRAIGGQWHSEIKESVTEKDFFLSLHGKLLIEIAEMDSFNKAEITKIKHVISCPTDRFRAPYAAVAKDHPRQCIFVGTTNESTYLRDDTGARRFWPIKCGVIDHAKIVRLREQLFAEATHKVKDGLTWWEMPEELTKIEQEKRRQTDPWEDSIAYYIIGKDEVLMEDIIKDALDIKVKDVNRMVQNRIAGALRLHGFERHTKRKDGQYKKTWNRVMPEQLEEKI